ncbi:MAG: TrmH family RNA methyltransferase [Candidatus Nanohaloarchaea archaeon]
MRSVVVVEPETPENTGFIARLCANFGFEMRLVDPCFNLEDARETANNAQQVLRDSRIYGSVDEAVEGLEFVVGTKPGRGVEASSFRFRENTSIMLGRESSGLSNAELERCDATVHIETSDYSSLNLSHAAAVVMHQALKPEGRNAPGDRLDFLRERTSEELGDLLARASPTEKEVDRVLKDLV